MPVYEREDVIVVYPPPTRPISFAKQIEDSYLVRARASGRILGLIERTGEFWKATPACTWYAPIWCVQRRDAGIYLLAMYALDRRLAVVCDGVDDGDVDLGSWTDPGWSDTDEIDGIPDPEDVP